jgi:hypothetical protein
VSTTARVLRDNVRARLGSIRLAEKARAAWGLRGPLGASLGVGLAVGGVGYLAGPVVSAVALGACGAALTLAAVLAAPLVRLWRALPC